MIFDVFRAHLCEIKRAAFVPAQPVVRTAHAHAHEPPRIERER
jgi:hypothetical protein